jgi:hypothetical protein
MSLLQDVDRRRGDALSALHESARGVGGRREAGSGKRAYAGAVMSRTVMIELVLLLCIIACSPPNSDDTRLAARPSTVNQADLPSPRFEASDAAARLALFLERAVLTSPEPVPDSLVACDWKTDSVLALATSNVLSADQRGDTVYASAAVLTVAEEHAVPGVAGRWDATLRTRRDTLQFKMVKGSETSVLGVCGYSDEGYDFIRHGYDVPGSSARRWRPVGASYARARQLVDSIRGR